MTRRTDRLAAGLAALWRTDAPLTATGMLMLGALAATAFGMWVDPRVITGAPAWMKPAKFAASTAIYSFTLAWVFQYLPAWVKTRRLASWTTVVTFVIEVGIISAQAWRGTASHFNVSSPMNVALFAVMGVSIMVQTLSAVTVAIALWRQPFADASLGWALRFGMAISIVGAMSAGLMTRPTEAQLAAAHAGQRITVAGAHTVGGPDGGPGLPGAGWSTHHGDLRIPHFVGLHAIQVLPLFALWLRLPRAESRGRRRTSTELPRPQSAPAPWLRSGHTRERLVITAAASYVTLFAILLWQALRGQSIVAPDRITLAVMSGWIILTALGSWIAASRDTAIGADMLLVSGAK